MKTCNFQFETLFETSGNENGKQHIGGMSTAESDQATLSVLTNPISKKSFVPDKEVTENHLSQLHGNHENFSLRFSAKHGGLEC